MTGVQTCALPISGLISERDSKVLSLLDGTQLRSRVVVLTPPEDPSSFTTGDLVPRIPRTEPSLVPRLDSVFSSFPTSLTSAHFDQVFMEDDGSFSLEVNIGTIPQNAFEPTTIWVQVIDGFENTDPDLSVEPIEVFYLPGGAPIARLFVVNFRGTGTDIQVFPPESLPESLLETFFIGLEEVRFRVETFLPLVEAPSLSLQQFGAQTRRANLLTSVDQVRGTTAFEYSYATLPSRGRFDGPAAAFVEEGRDLFGNAVIPLFVTTAIQIDSLAPNIVTTPPEFHLLEIPPRFEPDHGSRVRQQALTLSVDFDDFFPSNGSFVRSGIDTSSSELTLAGPLLNSPDLPVTTISVPPAPGYDLSIQVLDTLRDGVYRSSLKARDKVGNDHVFYSSFVFDETPVSAPLLVTNPEDGSTVAALPVTGPSQFIELEVRRIDVNLSKTSFQLIDPDGVNLPFASRLELPGNRIRLTLGSSIPLDGTRDGIYQIPILVEDLTGNTRNKTHTFLLDSKKPKIETFFPSPGSCVGPVQDIFDVQVRDEPGRNDLNIPVSGISSLSSLQLILEESSDPTTTLSPDTAIAGEIRLISGNDEASSEIRKVAFLPTQEFSTRLLNTKGAEDGKFRMEAEIFDSAGNSESETALFFMDTLSPEISIEGLSDGKLIGVTSGFLLDLKGKIQDRGFCHFFVQGQAYQGKTTLEIEIFQLDPDTRQRSAVFLPVTTLSDLEQENPEFSIHSAQASWRYTTFVPFQGNLTNQFFEVELGATDQSGNRGKIQRFFELVDRSRAIPAILNPPAFSVVDSRVTTFRTKKGVLSIRWQNIRGTSDVEIELYRLSESSVVPIHHRTYPSHLQESEPLSLSLSRPIVGLESYQLRIRGRDGDGLDSPWSPFLSFEVDARPLQVKEVFLLQDSRRLPLSIGQAFLTSEDIHLEVILNKRFKREVPGFFHLDIADLSTSLSLDSTISTTLTTDRLFLRTRIELSPREPYPRQPFQLTISNLEDLVGRKLSPFQGLLPVDYGAEPFVKVFGNPVNNRELIAVTRFLSSLARLESIQVIREEGEIVSPRFVLRKGAISRTLKPVPIEEGSSGQGAVAHSFSVPLQIETDDTGFYFLEIEYKDQAHRSHFKEREITVGRFLASRGLVLQAPSAGLTLRSNSRVDSSDQVFLVGNLLPLKEMRGEIELLQDLEIFGGAGDVLGRTVSLDLSAVKFSPILTNVLLLKRGHGELHFEGRLKDSREVLILEIGTSYVLGKDRVPPQWEWEGGELLSEGYQRLPIHVGDAGSGLDHSTLKVLLDSQLIKAKYKEDGVWLDVPPTPSEANLELSISDRSGLSSSMQRAVQVVAGWGLRWAQMVPNPIRSSNRASLHYFVEGIVQKAVIRFYDAAGSLLYSTDQSPIPGRNEVEWDLHSRSGDALSNGVYFFRITLEGSGRRAMKTGKFAILD